MVLKRFSTHKPLHYFDQAVIIINVSIKCQKNFKKNLCSDIN